VKVDAIRPDMRVLQGLTLKYMLQPRPALAVPAARKSRLERGQRRRPSITTDDASQSHAQIILEVASIGLRLRNFELPSVARKEKASMTLRAIARRNAEALAAVRATDNRDDAVHQPPRLPLPRTLPPLPHRHSGGSLKADSGVQWQVADAIVPAGSDRWQLDTMHTGALVSDVPASEQWQLGTTQTEVLVSDAPVPPLDQ